MSNSYGGAGTDRSEKIALTNVRVFDGRELRGPTTVVIEGGFVGSDSAGARVTTQAAPPCCQDSSTPTFTS